MGKLSKVLLDRPPEPKVRLDGASLDGGSIAVVGWDAARPSWKPGEKAELTVYFRAARRPSGDFLLQIEAWRPGAAAAKATGLSVPVRTPMRGTGGGLLPTSRWR